MTLTCLVAVLTSAASAVQPAADAPREIRVAAANSPAVQKAGADMICAGTNDERVINAAIGRLVFGGTVWLADGDYFVDAFEQEGNSAICFGYNGGSARVIRLAGTTDNKGYNTRHGVGIHVTERAFAAVGGGETCRVVYGAGRKPKAPGAFYAYTHVNNVKIENLQILLKDASRPVIGVDGRHFGSLYMKLVGVYTENYFRDRFLHVRPATPASGSVGVWSVPASNDEMSRIGYDTVNVGGLHTGFVLDGVDHLIMQVCSAARCCYGYKFLRAGKTMTMINCCDEGNTHLPHFAGRGHLTMIDFNIERFNAAYIPIDPDSDEHQATEAVPGGWHGTVEYTLQGSAFGITTFWKPGSGENMRTHNLFHSRFKCPEHPEFLETYFDEETDKTYTWNGRVWVDAAGLPSPHLAKPWTLPGLPKVELKPVDGSMDLEIVRRGSANAVVIASAGAEKAAEALACGLHEVSGVRLPVVVEGQATPCGLIPIYVGQGRFLAQSVFPKESLPAGAFRFYNDGSWIGIAGDVEAGVNDFLARLVGERRRKTIEIPPYTYVGR